MKIDTTTLAPWADINRLFSNMKTLTVKVGDDEYEGEAEIDSDNGAVTISFPALKKAKRHLRVVGD
jgi:hypothetical protein